MAPPAQPGPTPATKEQRWLTCAEKRCCYATTVYPSGADIHRIATTLFVPPWHFTVAVRTADGAPDGFALDRSPARYRAALAKGTPAHAGAEPCTFLIFALDGAARCGLGELRPGPCKSFPSYLVDGEVRLIDDVCSCRQWTLADVDRDAEKELLLQEARDRATYRRVIENWNGFVSRESGEEALEYADFCRYLLDAYAQLADAPV
jgi:hypothetical protein